MSPFPWLASFEIGHKEIDRQHHELVDDVTDFEGELNAGRFEAANAKCRAVRNRLENHLKYEERFLSDHDFPRLPEHIESHATALREIEDILAECCENCQIGLELRCTTRWFGAVLRHVLLADLDFKSHLQDKDIVSDY